MSVVQSGNTQPLIINNAEPNSLVSLCHVKSPHQTHQGHEASAGAQGWGCPFPARGGRGALRPAAGGCGRQLRSCSVSNKRLRTVQHFLRLHLVPTDSKSKFSVNFSAVGSSVPQPDIQARMVSPPSGLEFAEGCRRSTTKGLQLAAGCLSE